MLVTLFFLSQDYFFSKRKTLGMALYFSQRLKYKVAFQVLAISKGRNIFAVGPIICFPLNCMLEASTHSAFSKTQKYANFSNKNGLGFFLLCFLLNVGQQFPVVSSCFYTSCERGTDSPCIGLLQGCFYSKLFRKTEFLIWGKGQVGLHL